VEKDANPAYARLGSRATFRTRAPEWHTITPLDAIAAAIELT